MRPHRFVLTCVALVLAAVCNASPISDNLPLQLLNPSNESAFPWIASIQSRHQLLKGDVQNKNWMGQVNGSIADLTLLDITLPGTHDSGAYWLDHKFAPGEDEKIQYWVKLGDKFKIPAYNLIAQWALAQRETFYEQLSGGIRYLDIRACWDGQDWRTMHMIVGNTIKTLITDVRRFLDEVPSEVLVLQVSHFAGNPGKDQVQLLADIFTGLLGPYLYPRKDNLLEGLDTIGHMVRTNQRVLVTFEGNWHTLSDQLWPEVYEGSYANKDTEAEMESWNVDQLRTYGGNGRLQFLSWTLTPQASTIEKGLIPLPRFPHTLQQLAAKANEKLAEFYEKYKQYGLGNLLVVDDYGFSPAVAMARQHALRNCYDSRAMRARREDKTDCRSRMEQGQCQDSSLKSFMAQNCPLSCGFC
eukprot:Colp12_sorted_trinity150504_noHs@27332